MRTGTGLIFWMGVGVGITGACLLRPFADERGRRMVGKQMKKIKHSADDLMDAASDALDRGRSHLAKHQEGLVNAAAAGKKAYEQTVG